MCERKCQMYLPNQARAIAVRTKIINSRIAGLGSFRRSFHTTMLIDSILRAGDSANESVGHTR
jgi:hypothetical protein